MPFTGVCVKNPGLENSELYAEAHCGGEAG